MAVQDAKAIVAEIIDTNERWARHLFRGLDNPEPESELTHEAVSVAAALAELEICPDDRILIMLPDGPGFIDAFIGVAKQGAVPLAVNPHLEAADVAVVAAEVGAEAALITAQRVHALADLGAKPPVPVHGPQGLWAAAVRLR
jgi:acyl-CoA synthetase (AMP-forming)/AMP-acid ligase II